MWICFPFLFFGTLLTVLGVVLGDAWETIWFWGLNLDLWFATYAYHTGKLVELFLQTKSESLYLTFLLLIPLAVNPGDGYKSGPLENENCSELSVSVLAQFLGEIIVWGKDQWLKYAQSLVALKSYSSPLCFIIRYHPQHSVPGR